MKSLYLGSLVIDLPISFITRYVFPLKLYLKIPISLSFNIYRIHDVRIHVVLWIKWLEYFLVQCCWWRETGLNVCWLQEYPNSWIFYSTSCVQSISKSCCLYLQNICRIWNLSSLHHGYCPGVGSLILPVFLFCFICLLALIWYILLNYGFCHIHHLSFRVECRGFWSLVHCNLPSASDNAWHIVCTHIAYFLHKRICFELLSSFSKYFINYISRDIFSVLLSTLN